MSREAKKWNVLVFDEISSRSKNHASFDVTIPYRLQRILDKETIFRYTSILSTYANNMNNNYNRLNPKLKGRFIKFLSGSFPNYLKKEKKKEAATIDIRSGTQGVGRYHEPVISLEVKRHLPRGSQALIISALGFLSRQFPVVRRLLRYIVVNSR